jgi:YHS domain-containing protein
VVRWILLTILLLIIARMFWRVVDNVIEAAGGTPRSRRRSQAPAVQLVRDPVCGTHVTPNASLSLTARGTTHYFCSEKCRREFRGKRGG